MTLMKLCDYCGEEIGDESPSATLVVDAGVKSKESRWTSGWLGHYHSGYSKDCLNAVREAVKLVESVGKGIEGIPTISGQAVAARRRKHTMPEEAESHSDHREGEDDAGE
jgi:hypothetical protein